MSEENAREKAATNREDGMELFQIKSRFSGDVLFECELPADMEGDSHGIKLGYAVKKAVGARTNLAGANLTRADLTRTNLSYADLTGADLTRTNLAGANLTYANLTRTNLADAYLADANLARANLADANLARADLTRADLAGANLAGANLTYANLTRTNLADAYLADAYLADAYLAGANLAGACLVGANLAGANLARANLTYANLARADLTRTNLSYADLAGANLARAKFENTKWRDGIILQRAPLQLFGLDYRVTILDSHMQIGCECHTFSEWAAFDNERIARMDGTKALRFWSKYLDALLALAAADGRGSSADVCEGRVERGAQ